MCTTIMPSLHRLDGLPRKPYLRKMLRAGLVTPGKQGTKFTTHKGVVYWSTVGATLKKLQ